MAAADVLRIVGMTLQGAGVAVGLIVLRQIVKVSRWMQSTDDKLGEQARQIKEHRNDWRAHRR